MLRLCFIAIVCAVCYGLIGYELNRSQSSYLLLVFGVLFGLYGWILGQDWNQTQTRYWVGVGLFFRVLFLFSLPTLSDDYFRFVWDGRLLSGGINPYLYLPSQLIGMPLAEEVQLTKALFERLNSPHYYSVYPPINQFFFGVAAWLSGANLLLNVLILRAIILMAEGGTLWVLPKLAASFKITTPMNSTLIYALNPLVIVELTGNLHFEAVVLCFLLWGVWFLRKNYFYLSALMLSLSIGAKLLPLLFLPFFWRYWGWYKGLIYSSLVGILAVLYFVPFLSETLLYNFWSSLDLYFQKFEFNASVYYLLREVGYWFAGYNIIGTLGPVLSLLTLLFILWLTQLRRPLLHKMLFALTIYFLMATTVHPWYITPLVALGALSGYYFPIVWSVVLP
ncbi:MAG: hypothetical protein ACK4GN_10295, partial [Runella sp.]